MMSLTSGWSWATKASLSRLSLMWLCTWQPCAAASVPSPASSSGLHVGTKRGVTTGWTSGDPSSLHSSTSKAL